MCARACVCVCMCIYIYIYVCMYIYIYIYTQHITYNIKHIACNIQWNSRICHVQLMVITLLHIVT